MKKLIILSAIMFATSPLQGHIIRVPADRNTIQKGINAAKAGDTVLVSPGRYAENINYNGNFNADPLFAVASNDPFALSPESPCIDAGTNNIIGSLPAWDILGNVRLSDGNSDNIIFVDMGAYEFVRGATGVEDISHQNIDLKVRVYPNPFTFRTTFDFEMKESGVVNLFIYNNIGQPVAALVNEIQLQGRTCIEWNAEGLPPGIYFCRLAAGNLVVTRRIMKL